ncbi:gluconate:H+ symporter [Cytophagaceae bacterium DM2B3-1]|uniref:Gluconate:H+ symporter n=1 Tax=Xanthocytophaga flava TaxID=3048013 RepID=A0ABT7CLA0_9BACT|nr:gluconate:H+ symporter [Xanthocytophaga flavus]MDJ1468137.1 gluconate:H+ symporter [Xanthocytophaga flavus]MDJ1494506.1 gluconate:H+ symporter [Xanthocytophaga flavus]
MPVFLALSGILLLIFLISYVRLDTFISFILVSIGLGLATGMSVTSIGKSIQTGIGGTLGDLILIMGFGAMLGKVVAESGAAQRVTQALIQVFGRRYIQWGVALAGFIIGIPLFYNAGFIIIVPLIFTIASSTQLPLLYIAIPMCSALSVAHGYLPPHPSPLAISIQLKADIGETLLYGFLVAIPAIVVAGPLFGKTLRNIQPLIKPSLFQATPLKDSELPGLGVSLFVTLLPLVLLSLTSIIKKFEFDSVIIQLVAEPYIAMLISVLLAVYLLGLRRGKTMKTMMVQLEEAFKATSVILLIIAGAGALKQVLNDSGISQYIAERLITLPISPLILGWLMAGAVRICVGSATVAGLTAVGILAPMIQQQTGIKPELMVLSIGAGSLMLSHINDGGFWMFKEYFNLTVKQTLRTWTVMETIVSVVGLLAVLAVNALIV